MSVISRKDAALRARILKHMNNDHADSLSLYLRHYCSVSLPTASSAMIQDINFTEMTILDSSKTKHIVSITPPMTSWADARAKTVAMDAECRIGLDLPPQEHTEMSQVGKLVRYIPPQTLLQRTIFIAALGTYFLIISRVLGYLGPASHFHDHVASYWPWGQSSRNRADNFLWTLDRIAIPMLLLHLAEAMALERFRLQKYGVQRGSKVWWAWVSSTFVEGYGSWDRIAREMMGTHRQHFDGRRRGKLAFD